MDILEVLLNAMLVAAIPLMVVAIGAMFSERSGVINIALEGIMLFGAFFGVYFIHIMQKSGTMNGQLLLVLALLVAGIAGALISLLHSFAAITLKADQVISATAINIFSLAFVVFTARMLTGTQQIAFDKVPFIINVPVLKDIPVIAFLFNTVYITTYIGILIVIISWVVIFKTRFGLRLRACGEFPQAADSAGINVKRMRYIGVSISGFLGGIGGMAFVIPMTIEYNATVAGFGFLALAVLIFGQWKPYRIMFAALFFGFFKAIGDTSSLVPFLKNMNLNPDWYKMTPYVATLVLLAVGSKKSQAPKAAGEVYDKGKR